jgi:diguanylate cyclase (GGDEF)-like protein
MPREEGVRVRRRRTGVLEGAMAIYAVLFAYLGLSGLGVIEISLLAWMVAAGGTLVAAGALWLAAGSGWGRRNPWDPHFITTPVAVYGLGVQGLVLVAPDLRFVPLIVWPVILFYGVGLMGARSVTATAALVAAGYLMATSAANSLGAGLDMALEVVTAVALFVVSALAGLVVFRRMKRERREKQELRRKLSELASTDPLTSLPNRRRFEEILDDAILRARSLDRPCCLVMVDVDHFKKLNDTLGHVAGDDVLLELGSVMRRHLRVRDILARYGGEEFAIVMIDTNTQEARRIAERLRQLVSSYPFQGEHVLPNGELTISMGLAPLTIDMMSRVDLVRAADRMLYAAKDAGRNRCEVLVQGIEPER